MRRVSNLAVRGLAVAAVVVALTVPADARGIKDYDSPWLTSVRAKLVKVIGKIVSFGDGLSVPKP